MPTTDTKSLLASLAVAATCASASAATIDVAAFDVDPSNKNIATAGLLDWGHFISTGQSFFGAAAYVNTNWDAITDNIGGSVVLATTSDPTPSIGAVTITEDSPNGIEPTSGGNTGGWSFGGAAANGGTNGLAGNEAVGTLTFNDIGAGTRIVTLYMGHTRNNRIFDVDAVITAADGNDSDTTQSTAIFGTNNDGAFLYQIQVTTTDPNADLALSVASVSGGTGSFQLAGYTVAVPEPGSLALMGIGSLFLLRRRRRD